MLLHLIIYFEYYKMLLLFLFKIFTLKEKVDITEVIIF